MNIMNMLHQQISDCFRTSYEEVEWDLVQRLAEQIYHEAVFNRYSKKVNGKPFTGILDDIVSNVRTVYVNGGRIMQISKEWIIKGYDSESCLSRAWGTYTQS